MSQYWTFKPEAGDIPTLPVVALHVFALDAINQFENIALNTHSSSYGILSKGEGERSSRYEKVVGRIRTECENDPEMASSLANELEQSKPMIDPETYRKLRGLIHTYSGSNMRYLNFYGPPQTIATVPYHRILSSISTESELAVDFEGKAVFVGHSTGYQDAQKEGFLTVFSQSNGLDLSGVEMAATGFANLLEDSTLKPLDPPDRALVLAGLGIAFGFVCLFLPVGLSAIAVVGFGLCYLFAVELHFSNCFVWWPVAIPLFIQVPCSFLSVLTLKYLSASRERANIKKAIGYYLPSPLVNELAKNIAALKSSHQLVYGICLWTDAQQYSALSEKFSPTQLAEYMNSYFETIFIPVRRYGGMVSNVVADSMLALWIAAGPDSSLRTKACLAALDIAKAVESFKDSPDSSPLPTRIGLHSGFILLSSVGAIDHYEYRPIGDIVNTATRIEGLNKYLRTSILVSDEVLRNVEGLLYREVGTFIVAGKSRPLTLYQLMCREQEATNDQVRAASACSRALAAFRSQHWDEAMSLFLECKALLGNDGVAEFYIERTTEHKQHGISASWDGTIQMDSK